MTAEQTLEKLTREHNELKAVYQVVSRKLSETSRALAILRLEHAEIETENRNLRAEIKLLSFSKP